MNYIILDIETVENDKARELFAKKVYTAQSNLKDPAKIEANILEKRQRDMDHAALHWWTGKIICICANTLDFESKPITKPMTFIGDNEHLLLTSFFTYIDQITTRDHNVSILGKSSDYFDIPYIIGRSMALNLAIPPILKPRRNLTDVDHIFSFSSQCEQRSNLENYAFGLGMNGKNGHGSQIAGIYSQIQMGDTDKWNDIATYCANDTDIATELLRRYIKPYTSTVEEPALPPIPEQEIPFGP